MKRYKLKMFRYNNYKYMEEKLAKMAEKGWFLDGINLFFWSFRKGKPRRLTYEISFFPDGADNDYYKTEDQETFLEYCEDSGWKLVGNDGNIHVFATDVENSVPIENDEQLKLDNLHRCIKKGFSLIFIAFINIIMFFQLELDLWRKIPVDPEVIFTYEFFNGISLRLFLPLVVLYSLVDYGVWYIRSKKALSEGISYERRSSKIKRIIEKVVAYIMIAVLIIVFIGACLNGYMIDLLMILAIILIMVIGMLITGAFLKKSKMDKESKDIVFFVMLCLVIIAVMFMVDFFMKL